MEDSVFPPADLTRFYSLQVNEDGAPERDLKRFEIADSDSNYVRLGANASGLTFVGELCPTAAGKKENADLRTVVMVITGVDKVELRSDGAYWIRSSHAWYKLSSPHPRYADWWKDHSVHSKLLTSLERELASKNPRSFEQIISRLSREVPGQKNDVDDFVRRFGSFLLTRYESQIETVGMLGELKHKVMSLGAQSSPGAPDGAPRTREVDRACNKGNEWAASLVGVAPPQKSKKTPSSSSLSQKSEGPSDVKKQRTITDAFSSAASSTAQKKTKYPMEDMNLPNARAHAMPEFEPVKVSLQQSDLLNLFMVCEFVGAFSLDIFGVERRIEPSQLERWLSHKDIVPELEGLICDLLRFVCDEVRDPSVKRFGAAASAMDDGDEDEDNQQEEENNEDDKGELFHVPPLLRLKRLVPMINDMTWLEVLRRLLYTFRKEVSTELLTALFPSLEEGTFFELDASKRLEVCAFLTRKCLHTPRVRALVDETQANVAALKSEKTKRLKEVKAEFQDLLKKQAPGKPEENAKLLLMKKEIATKEAQLEKVREEGAVERNVVSQYSREVNKLRKEALAYEEDLRAEYDEIVDAPKNRDAALAKVEKEYAPRIAEEKAMMRIQPLGQDRWRRTFWLFDLNRDTYDAVLVHQDVDGGRWSIIDNVNKLKELRDHLDVKGIREKRLHDAIDEAMPLISERKEEEEAILSNPRTRRTNARKFLFGRVVEEIPEQLEDEVPVEPADKKPSPEKAKQTFLTRMQAHLVRFLDELPSGCVKQKDLERLSAKVDSAVTGKQLADILIEFEECVQSGWLGRSWTKERIPWIKACEHEEVPLPMFALLLYIIEFSIDRYYNPKLGKSEKPSDKTHANACTECNRPGQLLCCDTCPRVYHMHCLDPPLLHIPRGTWNCPKCSTKRTVRSTRATRRTISYAENAYVFDDEDGLPLRNERRSSRKSVRYNEDDEEEEDDRPRRKQPKRGAKKSSGRDDEEEEEEEEEESSGEMILEDDDDDDGMDEQEEEEEEEEDQDADQ